MTYGGYSKSIVVDEKFVISIPSNLDLAKATPLLCAGITTYSPLMHFGLRPNHRLAVIGLGGLGHMAVKFGVAFGAHVTVISRGVSKRESALNELHAHAFIDSNEPDALLNASSSFDLIICTVSSNFDLNAYIRTLKVNGKIILVGAPPSDTMLNLASANLLYGRRSVSSSLIGGIQETQDMLDFCGRHNITCDIELIAGKDIDTAYTRTLKSDVKYRFVIDMDSA